MRWRTTFLECTLSMMQGRRDLSQRKKFQANELPFAVARCPTQTRTRSSWVDITHRIAALYFFSGGSPNHPINSLTKLGKTVGRWSSFVFAAGGIKWTWVSCSLTANLHGFPRISERSSRLSRIELGCQLQPFDT